VVFKYATEMFNGQGRGFWNQHKAIKYMKNKIVINPRITFWQIIRSFGPAGMKAIKILDYCVGSLIVFFIWSKRRDESFQPAATQRLLIIRPGGIGDAVFLIPILRKLREARKDIRVDILCERRNREIFFSQEDICNELYTYDSLKSFLKVLRNSYDVVIDTEQWHYLSALVSYFIKHRHNIGFATRPLRSKLFNSAIAYEQNAYEIENFRKLFLGILPNNLPAIDIHNCFEIGEEKKLWAEKFFLGPTVSIFLGGSIAIRRLNKPQALEIIRYLLKKDISVAVLGGGDVYCEGQDIEKEISNSRLLNFVGKATLIQSAAIIQRSRLFIGPDSGLMHLASAVGTPVIGIFGPGNLKKWAPRGGGDVVITENVECSPCTRFGYTVPTCRGSYKCVKEIKTEQICRAADRCLS